MRPKRWVQASTAASFAQILDYLLFEGAEALFLVVDLVHLVDDDSDLGDAQHVQEITVAARLLADAFRRIDDKQRSVGAGRATDHVRDEFLVARGIDDQIVALPALEADLGYIDRYSLVALRLQGVKQIGPLDALAALPGNLFERLYFLGRDRIGVVQQAADQGGFAMVDVADDDDPQDLTLAGGFRERRWHQLNHILCHYYMYPFVRRRSKASSDS